MKIKIETKILLDSIKAMEKALGPLQSLTLKAEKTLTLSAQSAGKSVCCIFSEAKVEEKGQFTVQANIFTGILKNRKEISLELSKDKCYFKAGSSKDYAGHLVVLPFADVKVDSEDTSLEFTDSIIERLNEIINNISITDVHLKSANILPLCIKLGPDGIEASCAARYHMAYARDKETKFKKEQDFCISADVIPTMSALAKNTAYKLAVTDNSIFASNEFFKAKFSLQQFDRFVTLPQVKLMVNKFTKTNPEAKIKVKTKDLTATLDNLISVYEENAPVELSVNKKFKAETKTKFGSVSDIISGDTSGKTKEIYSINPFLINDLLVKCKIPELKIGLYDSRNVTLFFDRDRVNYVYSCSVIG